jgi:hypothetical protein
VGKETHRPNPSDKSVSLQGIRTRPGRPFTDDDGEQESEASQSNMIFSIQRFLEDYFARMGLRDADQYAVGLANLYDRERRTKSATAFLKSVRRIRTIFYQNNHELSRQQFEKSILSLLDENFKKKASSPAWSFPGGISRKRRLLQAKQRVTISSLLDGFRHAVESRAIDTFWVSRKANELRPKPERIGQALLSVFAKGVLSNRGLVWREVLSGIGFVDVVLVLGRIPHLIELKIMKSRYDGAAQLGSYMKTECRRAGWLVLFDARRHPRSDDLPAKVGLADGIINNIIIDINPVAPSHLKSTFTI